MKRSFSHIDDAIPESVWEFYPTEREQLNRCGKVENKSNQILNHQWRRTLGRNAEITPITKHVRVFIRHEYFPKTIPQVCYNLYARVIP